MEPVTEDLTDLPDLLPTEPEPANLVGLGQRIYEGKAYPLWTPDESRGLLLEVRRLRDKLDELTAAAAFVCDGPGESENGDATVDQAELVALRAILQRYPSPVLVLNARIVHRRTREVLSEEFRIVVRARSGGPGRVRYDLVAPRGSFKVTMVGICEDLADEFTDGSRLQIDTGPALSAKLPPFKCSLLSGYGLDRSTDSWVFPCKPGDVVSINLANMLFSIGGA